MRASTDQLRPTIHPATEDNTVPYLTRREFGSKRLLPFSAADQSKTVVQTYSLRTIYPFVAHPLQNGGFEAACAGHCDFEGESLLGDDKARQALCPA